MLNYKFTILIKKFEFLSYESKFPKQFIIQSLILKTQSRLLKLASLKGIKTIRNSVNKEIVKEKSQSSLSRLCKKRNGDVTQIKRKNVIKKLKISFRK